LLTAFAGVVAAGVTAADGVAAVVVAAAAGVDAIVTVLAGVVVLDGGPAVPGSAMVDTFVAGVAAMDGCGERGAAAGTVGGGPLNNLTYVFGI
jgi:hypothetical protein